MSVLDGSVETSRSRVDGSRVHVRSALSSAALALVLGIAAIHAVVVAVVHRPLADLEGIGDEHARAVAIATRIRGHLSELRRRVVTAVEAPHGSALNASGDFTALGAATAELVPVADTPVEQRELAALREALRDCALTVGRVEDAHRTGRITAARQELPEFLEDSAAASDAADRIVLFNVHQVQDSARCVHRGILFALTATSVLGIIVVASAIALIRIARGAVERNSAALERNAEEMSAFAGRAAHELRAPLHTLSLSLALLRANGSARALDRAEASARRLRETIDDLLEFSRAGGTPDPGAHADVADAVHEVLVDAEAPAEAAGVVLKAEVPDGLEVLIAPGHLRVVLANLVTNAVKYGAEVPGALVEVAAATRSGHVDIVVRDTGPGIPQEAVSHIFEPWYRASARPDGYGLGLATVKRLVDAHGGTVEVTTERGHGTAITLHLPATNDAASERRSPG